MKKYFIIMAILTSSLLHSEDGFTEINGYLNQIDCSQDQEIYYQEIYDTLHNNGDRCYHQKTFTKKSLIN